MILLTFEFRHDNIGFLGHLLINILALLIVFVNMLGLAKCYIVVFFYQ